MQSEQRCSSPLSWDVLLEMAALILTWKSGSRFVQNMYCLGQPSYGDQMFERIHDFDLDRSMSPGLLQIGLPSVRKWECHQ